MSTHIVTQEMPSGQMTGEEVLKFLYACQRLEKLAAPAPPYKSSKRSRRHERKRQQSFTTKLRQSNGEYVNLAQLFQQAVEHLTKLFRESQETGYEFSSGFIPNYETILNIRREITDMPNIRLHTIGYISRKYNITESTLQRNFKKIFKMTVHEYVTMMCMEKAQRLRKAQSMNIEDIAEELGYSDRSGFFKTYKKWQEKYGAKD